MTRALAEPPADSRESETPGVGDAERRVGVLVGDRACTKCQFNLVGQPIVREPHYGLLIAQCPECGTAAALQEYPLLGRWVNRVGFALGAAWMLLLVGFLAINVIALVASTIGVTTDLLGKYAQFVRSEYKVYRDANSPPPANASPWGMDPFSWDWWEKQDHAAMFERAGGWAHGIDWASLVLLVIPAALALCFGGLWSVALPNARRWARLIPLGVVGGVGVVVLMFQATTATAGARGPWSWRGPDEAVYADFWWALHPIAMSVFAVAFLAGLRAGRAVARWVIVAFLPPRLRAPWSFLWLSDRKPLPRP